MDTDKFGHHNIMRTEVEEGLSGPRLLARGHSGHLTSSFRPCDSRKGDITRANTIYNRDTVYLYNKNTFKKHS